MNWTQIYQLQQIRHAELIREREEWNLGRELNATKDQSGAQTRVEEKQSQVLRRGEGLAVLTADGKKAAGE